VKHVDHPEKVSICPVGVIDRGIRRKIQQFQTRFLSHISLSRKKSHSHSRQLPIALAGSPGRGRRNGIRSILTNDSWSGKGGTNSMPLGGVIDKGKRGRRIGAFNDRPNLPQGRPASNGWQEGQK
jgi:hypothetical protein